MSSVTPESRRSCSDNCSCVVDHGWIASVLASPTLIGRLVDNCVRLGLYLLCQIGDQLEVVDHLFTSSGSAFEAE